MPTVTSSTVNTVTQTNSVLVTDNDVRQGIDVLNTRLQEMQKKSDENMAKLWGKTAEALNGVLRSIKETQKTNDALASAMGELSKQISNKNSQQSQPGTQTPNPQPAQPPSTPLPSQNGTNALPAMSDSGKGNGSNGSKYDQSRTPVGTQAENFKQALDNSLRMQRNDRSDQNTFGLGAKADNQTGQTSQEQEALALQQVAARNAVIVEVLKKIQGLLTNSLSKFEQFNDEMRRNYHMSRDTSVAIMDNTVAARNSVRDSLDVHISMEESVKAIKEQVLNNGVNAEHLNSTTRDMVVGLNKFGMKVDQNTLMTLDAMDMDNESQKQIMNQFMKMSSGDNTYRADVSKMNEDFKYLVALSRQQGMNNAETSKLIREYGEAVQQNMALGISQQESQKAAMDDIRKDIQGIDMRGKDPLFLELFNIGRHSGASVNENMSMAEMVKAIRSDIESGNEDVKRNLTARINSEMGKAAITGDQKAMDNVLKLDRIINGKEGTMVTDTEQAKKGFETPMLERWKDNVETWIGSKFTGAVGSMWGFNGKGTTAEILTKGFNALITILTIKSAADILSQTKIGNLLKGSGGKLGNLLKGGVTKLGSGLLKVAGPLALIVGLVTTIMELVKGIKEKNENEEDRRAKQEELDRVTKELKDNRQRASMAQVEGDASSQRVYGNRATSLAKQQQQIAGELIEARYKENVAKYGTVGTVVGATTGGVAAGLATGGNLMAIGAGTAGGAFAGKASGEAIAGALSDKNTASTRADVIAAANAGEVSYNSNGNIIDKDTVTHVGEGGNVEVILPANNPERMKYLAGVMSKRADVSQDVRASFSAMADSLASSYKKAQLGNKHPDASGEELSDGAKSMIERLLQFASSNKGKEYELHGRRDPRDGHVWEGFVCNELVSNAFKSIGRNDLYSRFSYGVSSILFGYDLKEKRDKKGNIKRHAKHVKGLLEDDDWVSVGFDDIKPGMLVFTGLKEKPSHVGIASGDGNYWNASGSASDYTTPSGFLATRTKNTGVVNKKIPKKNFKYAGYFKSLFGDYAKALDFVPSGVASETDPIGDEIITSQIPPVKSSPVVSSGGSDESGLKSLSLFDMISSFGILENKYRHQSRNGILKDALVRGILSSKAGSVFTNPMMRKLLGKNFVDVTQDGEIKSFNPLRSFRVRDGMPTAFGSLEEGFEDYIKSIEHNYAALKEFTAMQQLNYLREQSIISKHEADSIAVTESMQELAREVKELTREVKEQNRTSRTNELRNASMPFRPAVGFGV